MSLLLTKTCEYAILVSIQQGTAYKYTETQPTALTILFYLGRYFPTRESYKIETELDLKLPPSIDDLIPTKTIISSPVQKVDVNGHLFFNVSLVYFVSFKQLQRLRRNDATTTLTIKRVSATTEKEGNNKLLFSISEAKEVIPQSQHKLDHIYKFVSDKGAWYTIPENGQQLKVGLFYVAMPDNTGLSSSAGSVIINTPSIQLRSPPPTPIMPKSSRITSTAAANAINSSNRKNKKIASILGSSSSLRTVEKDNSIMTTNTSATTTTTRKKKYSVNEDSKPVVPQRITLRRKKSSLVDLNIEELADVLAKINIFNTPTPQPPKPPQPAMPTRPKDIPEQQCSYHQIGKGSSQYTFYFKIIYADHIKQQILLRQSTPTMKKHLKKPFFSYSFLTNYSLVPAASISRKQEEKCCFQLRGHLVDIQNWLDAQESIKLSYIIMDKYTKETVGNSRVPLKRIAFTSSGMMDKHYPVLNNSAEDVIAQVTIRIGLVSGWHKEEEYTEKDTILNQQKRGSLANEIDPWDLFLQQNSNKRHHSQSSVPTLLTSSTTSSTTAKSSKIPSIHYIPQQQRPSLKSSKYYNFSSATISYNNK
jgi:hypothetical protein